MAQGAHSGLTSWGDTEAIKTSSASMYYHLECTTTLLTRCTPLLCSPVLIVRGSFLAPARTAVVATGLHWSAVRVAAASRRRRG